MDMRSYIRFIRALELPHYMETFRSCRLGISVLLLTIFAVGTSAGLPTNAVAQSTDIIWSSLSNLSNSPKMASVDPFLLADPAGLVHLFWAEKVGALSGNLPDTVIYSQWDGQNWSQPLDIYFAPTSDGNLAVNYPHAVLDSKGFIHLIWISQPNFPYYTLYYGSAPASQAKYVQSWTSRKALAEDLSGTKYSIHIAVDASNTLHVIYVNGSVAANSAEERGVKYLRSTDGGATWSEPASIFTVSNLNWGASDTRIIAAPSGRLFASWTVWDETGNGLSIYFARSLDNGLTWDDPVMLTQKRDDEYERDWNNLIVLPDQRLMAIWEGGFRAYRNAMYSSDNGASWTEAVDLFPRLIGENGYAEFAYDGSGWLHLFYAQRIREGAGIQQEQTVEGLWHSVWDGEKSWKDPVLVGGINPMVNPKTVIVRGNRVIAVWYSSLESEIITMSGAILGAKEIPPTPWPESSPILRNVTETVTGAAQTLPAAVETVQPPLSPTANDINHTTTPDPLDPMGMIYRGALPSLVVIAIFFAAWKWKHRQ